MNGTVTVRDGWIEVVGPCEGCGGTLRQLVEARGWHRWRAGAATVDAAFPGITSVRRAALVEGLCPDCHAERVRDAEDGNG